MNKEEFLGWLDGLDDAMAIVGGSISSENLIAIVRDKAETLKEESYIVDVDKVEEIVQDCFEKGKKAVNDRIPNPNDWYVTWDWRR